MNNGDEEWFTGQTSPSTNLLLAGCVGIFVFVVFFFPVVVQYVMTNCVFILVFLAHFFFFRRPEMIFKCYFTFR